MVPLLLSFHAVWLSCFFCSFFFCLEETDAGDSASSAVHGMNGKQSGEEQFSVKVPIWNTFASWMHDVNVVILCRIWIWIREQTIHADARSSMRSLVIDSKANYLKLSDSQTIWGCYGQQRTSNVISSTWSPAMATVTC